MLKIYKDKKLTRGNAYHYVSEMEFQELKKLKNDERKCIDGDRLIVN